MRGAEGPRAGLTERSGGEDPGDVTGVVDGDGTVGGGRDHVAPRIVAAAQRKEVLSVPCVLDPKAHSTTAATRGRSVDDSETARVAQTAKEEGGRLTLR